MTVKIDVDGMVRFLEGLLNTPSPVGDAGRAIAYVRDALQDLGLKCRIASKGYLTATLDGDLDDAPRSVTAHADTLGAMVAEVKSNGRLALTRLGNWLWSSVEGEGVTVLPVSQPPVRGTILPIKASHHAYDEKTRKEPRNDGNMEVRLDALVSTKEDVLALGIRAGDFVPLDPRVEVTEAGFIRSRHLDDKAGVAAIYGAVVALLAADRQPRQRTTIHISNYEEAGHGGAVGFPDDLAELLVVDMAVVAPGRLGDETKVTICAKDSSGPYHVEFRRRLEALCQQLGLGYSTDIYPFYASDGSAYWSSGGDVPVALIGPGVDASHHYERTHRNGLEATAQLVAEYLLT